MHKAVCHYSDLSTFLQSGTAIHIHGGAACSSDPSRCCTLPPHIDMNASTHIDLCLAQSVHEWIQVLAYTCIQPFISVGGCTLNLGSLGAEKKNEWILCCTHLICSWGHKGQNLFPPSATQRKMPTPNMMHSGSKCCLKERVRPLVVTLNVNQNNSRF